ncbi:MAG TPA: GrpB family protein [Acidimicrobiia bacterium]|nr:GrpB family protein [Acidimicrobiia bacterium]
MSTDDWLIGGHERRAIVIEPYDPAWPVRFAHERACITDALGPAARRVEHIGSTSVPGLGAKPIVDILVVVDDVDDVRVGDALELAGYVLRVREPGHRMFRRPDRSVHVHLWPTGSDDVRRHLLFRDRLRVDAGDRARYEAIKRELARCDWDDMNDYADAKSAVVAEITARAEAWAARTGWQP